MHTHREKVNAHVKREKDLQAKHEEFKKDVAELEEQLELITRDSATLENSFDDLHQRYVKLKAVHQHLTDRNKVFQQYVAELKAWSSQDGNNTEELQRDFLSLQQRYNIISV